ncbi:DUF6082 family protein [Streptomyces smyrnaeus]|uniref:DUF6082 family protein n=1 Tax=Streptomyces smyrnaeus TaxID=1387713 RepID=UPI0033AF1085
MRRVQGDSGGGRSARIVGWSALVLALGAGLLGTPFVLRAIAPDGVDWSELSDVSQTYSAVSVLISAAALAGVVASLVYQARQTQTAQEEASRSTHRELVVLSLTDPVLQSCWEPPKEPVTPDEWRRLAFTNMIVTWWENSFRLGHLTEEQLRLMLMEHFRGAPARAHWAQAREGWLQHADAGGSRRARRFPRLADQCYLAAVEAGAAVHPEDYFRTERA